MKYLNPFHLEPSVRPVNGCWNTEMSILLEENIKYFEYFNFENSEKYPLKTRNNTRIGTSKLLLCISPHNFRAGSCIASFQKSGEGESNEPQIPFKF